MRQASESLGGALVLMGCVLSCGGGGGGGSGGGASGQGRPAAPTSIQFLVGDGQVQFTWDPVDGAVRYTLYWDVAPGIDRKDCEALEDVTSPTMHSGLHNGTTYFYVLTASNSHGESLPSVELSCTPEGAGGSSACAYAPVWSGAVPTEILSFDFNLAETEEENGKNLKDAIQHLTPGQRLEIGAGTYSIDSYFTIALEGTESQPIWIAAKSGESVTLTRPDANQNCVNIGSGGPTRYLVLEHLEILGGDTAVKLYDCQNLWIHQCHIHDCEGAGIAANSHDTAYLYLTCNEVHDTEGTAEGMYLGANYGDYVMSHSVIANNHVYNTFGTQGDGIEVKQGSFDNWIVDNLVHDCQYPCILLYGTDGEVVNVVERNVCFNSGDNVMQVQGEAIVRNNLLINGDVGLYSHNHQGQTTHLQVLHNTILNSKRGAELTSWNNRDGMVFANNVVYSRDSDSIRFSNGSGLVTVIGNVVVGDVKNCPSGWVEGTGLTDFLDVEWDASAVDARPDPGGSLLGTADETWLVSEDLDGLLREFPFESGCYEDF